TIAGGIGNFTLNDYSAVGGGDSNQATGSWATVPGGLDNVAGGQRSFAAGSHANASHDGCMVFSDASSSNPTTCGASNQFLVRATGGVYLFTGGNMDSNYSGAYLNPGSSSWLMYSDRAGKDNVSVVEPRDVLNR